MQAATPAQDSSKWSVIQLLLILATLATVLLVPSLKALVPNFNGHILPSLAHKVRLGTLHDARTTQAFTPNERFLQRSTHGGQVKTQCEAFRMHLLFQEI